MSEARDMFDRYISRLGLHASADAAQNYQVALMRQWIDHLDEVLDANHVPGQLRVTIVREFLYGAMPTDAEAELRQEMTTEMTRLAAHGPVPPFTHLPRT